jgi:hypothetical protein
VCLKPTDTGIQIFSYECECCEQVFKKNFSHPAFNFDHPWCWHCLEEYKPNEDLHLYPVPFVKKPPPKVFEFEGDIFDFNLLED